MRTFVVNGVLSFAFVLLLYLYLMYLDPIIRSAWLFPLGGVLLPMLVGVLGVFAFRGPALCRILLPGLAIACSVALWRVMTNNEYREPEADSFVLILSVWVIFCATLTAAVVYSLKERIRKQRRSISSEHS